ncbi:hypothetical protein MNBD_ALPHA02-419 [hydrothermal vent metagenome]|uniref:AMIN domain-containing protein n=1 Tax=hydrothermal vent metagenome TaxID=652676 RepID=A0A3B0RR30_9ZZZZ
MPKNKPYHQKAKNRGWQGVKIFLFTSLFCALAVMPVRAEVSVIDVRTGLHPDKTRVVLEVSEVAFYQISYQDNPREIIIDLRETPGMEEVRALARKAAVIGVLDKITVEDHEGSVRLLIALRKLATVDNSFTLKPDHGRQFRLVFDIKATSAAEWARQVKLTAPPPAPEPVKEPVALPPPVAEEISAFVSESPPEPQSPETYDDMLTEDSNFTLSGYVEMEARGFPQSAMDPAQEDWTVSFALEPLLEYVSDSSSSQIMFRPFGRVDVQDKSRSHFDIRELKWTGTLDSLQMTVGIDTVFWGVTESNHLVDIINQNDSLEDIDREDKLGQPMASLSYDSPMGVFSVYVMTYFREQRLPGAKGRLRLPLPVDYTQTQYEAGSGKWNTDWAVRWTHVIGNVDVGLYHFRGTSREAQYLLGVDGTGSPVIIPRYNLIGQTGLDLQGTFDDILIKFEAIRRTGFGPDYWAMAGGFEYTLYGLGGGDSDIGILAEYSYDDRGSRATTIFQNDMFVGMRWAANDVDSTELLMGAMFDMTTSSKFVNIEGSRRIGENWKVSLDARFFLGVPVTDIIYPLSRDDFFQIRLARYF